MAPSLDIVRNDPKLIKRAVILAAILAGLQVADPIVASLALPKAGRDLDMHAATLALAASISTLFLAATVVLFGAVGDRIGRRKMMFLTTAGTAAGDLLVVVAPTSAVYMLGRAFAGMCVGGLLATSYPYVRSVSPPDRLGVNLGIWGGLGAAVALPTSILASGLASINWRLAFLCVPAVALLCLPLQQRVFPRLAPLPIKKQLFGVSIAGLGVVGLLFGLSQVAGDKPSVMTIDPIVAGVVLLGIAGVIGLRSSTPAYPVRIFRSPVFVTAAVSGALWNLATAVGQLQSSNLWQYVEGVTPFTASLLLTPVTITLVVGSFMAGRILAKGMKPREIITLGLIVTAIGLLVMSAAGANAIGVWFICGMMLLGFGAGAAGVAQSQILVTEAPPEYVGPIAASRTTFGQLGYAIGLAGSSVLTTILTIRALGTPDARDQLDSFLNTTPTGREHHAQGGSIYDVVVPSYIDGFKTSMIVWAILFVIGAAVCFALMSMRPHPLKGATTATTK